MNNSETHTKIGKVLYFLCQYKTYQLSRQYISKTIGVHKFTPNSHTNSEV